ncbi:S8 family serine peptidase [Jeotgalibacillus soli]|uniref:Peptidase S8/S53 domain-containing protein n=1 Tax=Jeotgalibacillus soli TaxID=889306 RepID=A0A0C2S709_9BACL|nr:S8 family serine peptidase [Jeotgalibacillus soli]KIL49824.1 hypothetical protein KP78_12920 [Jeotgalibacillus soli]
MKRMLVVLVILFLGSSQLLPNGLTQAEENSVSVPEAAETDRVIVKLKDDALNTLKNAETITTLSEDGKSNELLTVEVPEGKSIEGFMKELEEKPNVESVEPDHIYQLMYTPNDPDFTLYQTHHRSIETARAWNKSTGSAGVTVAVIDDGIDLTHQDLADRIVAPFNMVTGSQYDLWPGEHGTHVAGIIAASMDNLTGGAGVAPNANIMPIDVFNGYDGAYLSDVIDAIYYAVDSGADIINMSLGGYEYSSNENDAIQYAHQRGVLVVAAAGNDNVNYPSYPASYNNVISVASTTASDGRSYFSNFGPYVDIAAPGSSVYSTLPFDWYGEMSGTSMASPVVAGVAALVLASEPQLTNTQLATRLTTTADDLGAAGRDDYYGHGRVNAKKALNIKDLPVPAVSEVFDNDGVISGTVSSNLANATIRISDEWGPLAEGTAAGTAFSVPIPVQPEGTKIFVSVIDGLGNSSVEKKITVLSFSNPVRTDRIFGADRYSTAVELSKTEWVAAHTVVLARGSEFPDALAGAPLAYKEKAPILLTREGALSAQTRDEILRLGATKVILLGGPGAISENVRAELEWMDIEVERIGGADRYETAALIAKKLNSSKAFIAFGGNFPDALAVAPYAAKNGIPILLTRSTALPSYTTAALNGKTSTIVVGSTGVVNNSVFNRLPNPVRYGGATRYDTAKAIAENLSAGTDTALIATGENFPDALAGSVIAARNNGTMLLVQNTVMPAQTKSLITRYKGFTVIGGEGLIGNGIRQQLEDVLKP